MNYNEIVKDQKNVEYQKYIRQWTNFGIIWIARNLKWLFSKLSLVLSYIIYCDILFLWALECSMPEAICMNQNLGLLLLNL